MRFREICPHWETIPTESLLRQAGFAVLNPLIPRIAEWYKVHLPLWAVLQVFGYTQTSHSGTGPRYPLICDSTVEEQVSCILPSHGGRDSAPSARYYLTDRNELSHYGHIYCWGSNCQKAYTSFWYAYAILKEQEDYKYADVILWLERTFRIAFPRHIILDADPDTLDDDGENTARGQDMRQRFLQVKLLRETVRGRDMAQFLAAMAELYARPLQANPELAPHA